MQVIRTYEFSTHVAPVYHRNLCSHNVYNDSIPKLKYLCHTYRVKELPIILIGPIFYIKGKCFALFFDIPILEHICRLAQRCIIMLFEVSDPRLCGRRIDCN